MLKPRFGEMFKLISLVEAEPEQQPSTVDWMFVSLQNPYVET